MKFYEALKDVRIEFSEIKESEVLMYNEKLYMKISPVREILSDKKTLNAVSLETGECVYFSDDEKVAPLYGAKLVY